MKKNCPGCDKRRLWIARVAKKLGLPVKGNRIQTPTLKAKTK